MLKQFLTDLVLTVQKITIQASNIHQGGGAVLLADLLNSVHGDGFDVKLLVDSRYMGIISDKIETVKVKPSILSRLSVEFQLRAAASKNENMVFLFFGNLPPLFKSNKQAHLFFQNLILLESSNMFQFNWITTLKHFVEKLWLKIGIQNIHTVYVQSETAKRLFLREFPASNVKVFGFSDLPNVSSSPSHRQGFLYVASANPHKNHLKLIEAWICLFKAGVKEQLILTADGFSMEEIAALAKARSLDVEIVVKSGLPREEVLGLYLQAKALIYPSFTESFGLPLLEAKRAGLPIIASELDYVRDMVEPEQTFDPNSELSIARAVMRFLRLQEPGKTIVKTADSFVTEILST